MQLVKYFLCPEYAVLANMNGPTRFLGNTEKSKNSWYPVGLIRPHLTLLSA